MTLPKRTRSAIKDIPTVLGRWIRALVHLDRRSATALAVVFCQLLGTIFFDTPINPHGAPIDLSRYQLIWQDEFDRGFDDTVWQGHYVYGDEDTQLRDTAWWNREQVSFTQDGCLVLTAEYKENGSKGAGYYSYGMETNPAKNYNGNHVGYEQLYGYFEIRCILPKGAGLNPAFWLLTDGMWADDTDGGVSGCEIDILETGTSFNTKSKDHGSVFQTIHVDGYGDAHKMELQGSFYADDPYEKFNTYGVAWNENEYIFYINGIETARTDFGGVCRVPLYLILSLGVDENIKQNTSLPAQFIIDYVRAYQLLA